MTVNDVSAQSTVNVKQNGKTYNVPLALDESNYVVVQDIPLDESNYVVVQKADAANSLQGNVAPSSISRKRIGFDHAYEYDDCTA